MLWHQSTSIQRHIDETFTICFEQNVLDLNRSLKWKHSFLHLVLAKHFLIIFIYITSHEHKYEILNITQTSYDISNVCFHIEVNRAAILHVKGIKSLQNKHVFKGNYSVQATKWPYFWLKITPEVMRLNRSYVTSKVTWLQKSRGFRSSVTRESTLRLLTRGMWKKICCLFDSFL